MNKLKINIISIITVLAVLFITQAIVIVPQAYADHPEPPCWNSGTLVYPEGGIEGRPLHYPNEKGEPSGYEPINLTNGSFQYKHTDIHISCRRMPLEITRTYNNRDKYDGPFGPGWNHNYNIQLMQVQEGAETIIVRRNGDGIRDYFTLQSDGAYIASAGCYDTLTMQADGYRIYTPQKTIYNFDLDGRLTLITDRDNNRTTFQYSSGRLITITSATGRTINIEYGANRKISSVTDWAGRVNTYQYNSADDLASVTTPGTTEYPRGLTTAYSYTNHNLESITDAKGQVYLINQYDGTGRVIRQTYGGDVTTLSYDNSAKITTATDARGNTVSWIYNSDDLLTSKIEYIYNNSSQSYVTRYEYNNNRKITKIIYPRGNVIEYTYDSAGDITGIRRKTANQPDSADDIVYTYTYDPIYNRIKTYIDPEGNTYTITFDYQEGMDYAGIGAKTGKTAREVQDLITSAGMSMGLGDINGDGITGQINGNAIGIQYPTVTRGTADSRTIRYFIEYNQYGQITVITNPLNIKTRLGYDSNFYLNQVIKDYGRLNLTTGVGRDSVGNITSVTDPGNNTTIFTVNELNQIKTITSPAPFRYQTVITYDANGSITQIDKQTNDSSNPWQTTTIAYTLLDKIETITDELNNTVTYAYDPNGNLHTITDAENKTTAYDYDFRDQIITTTDALGNITSYTYDANGSLETTTDSADNQTIYTYDLFDRETDAAYPDNSRERYGYDKNSNTTRLTKRNEDIITYRYDEINRLYRKEYPDGTNISCIHDKLGRLTDVTNDQGTASYVYDRLNRVQSATVSGKTISYQYDNNGNRIRVTYPDSLGYFTYWYDELNRLTDIKDSADNTIAHYTFNALSFRNTFTYLNGITTTYSYDNLSRLVSVIASGREAISYTYDNVGNKQTMTNEQGTHNYDYDDIYQLTGVSGALNLNFAYDVIGNRTSATNGITTTYTTNNLNQYSVIASGSEAISYSYDINGNLTNEGTNTYDYDYDNRLTNIVIPAEAGIQYSYDGFGRRISKTIDGVTTYYLYDGDNLLAEYNSSWEPLIYYVYSDYIDEPVRITNTTSTYYYHADSLGSVTAITDSSGDVVERYQYDAYGNVTIRNAAGTIIPQSAIGNRFMFTAREYDAETGLYYYRTRYYSPTLGRFLQTDPIGYYDSMNLYTYVNNNPVNWIDPWGLYGSDVHRDKTKEWGKDVGLPEDVAGKISYHNQKEDTRWTGPFVYPFSTWQHFRDRQSVEKDLQDSINGGNIVNFGRYLHEYQDSYSHYDEGFRWWTFGHIGYGDLCDFYDENTPRDQRMEAGTKKWLKKWKEKECK